MCDPKLTPEELEAARVQEENARDHLRRKEALDELTRLSEEMGLYD